MPHVIKTVLHVAEPPLQGGESQILPVNYKAKPG